MYRLGQKAEKYHRAPSDYFPDLVDEWTRYQFDGAVSYLCTVIDNALLEREEVGVGDKKSSQPKYTLDQLLHADFRLQRPPRHKYTPAQGAAALRGPGIKVWKQVAP